ncbi:uncharacterized protein LY79DRAFT_504495 [Colletotrichum navitas]|uniref:Uncharacterized protein n=1 Tax=Colletotrichum navitas TaxID=681940 RepID=A0AAD8QBI5_9PEZI|nr:uncharacterized protein LY79DRAFT_504495 [Colletotrichum navitas]KAK1599350.1 hypothetical protein LY79DRAFT_504495 [Colletotrichum navitas]
MKNDQRLSSGSPIQRPTFGAADLITSTSPSGSALLSPCLTTEPQSPTQNACLPLPPLESPSLEKHGQRYEMFSVRVEGAYDTVLSQLDSKRFRRSKETRRRFDIKVQKASCLKTVKSLVGVLVSPPLEAASSQDASIEVCTQIDDALNSLWIQLSYLARDIARFGQRYEVRLSRMRSLCPLTSLNSPDCSRTANCLLKLAGKIL